MAERGAWRGRRVGLIVAGLALTAGVAVVIFVVSHAQPRRNLRASGDPRAVPVTVATVQRRDVPILVRGIGSAQAYQSVVVQARVTGWLDRIAFQEGQTVKPGDLLAVIDPRPYAAAMDQAQAKQAGDAAQLANNQANLRRDASLAQRDFASRQQVDNDTEAVRQMEAAVRGDVAAVETAQLNLDFCQIVSPIDGVVGFTQVTAGNLIQAGGPGIVTITQVKPISVVFTLPQSALPNVQAALRQGTPAVTAVGQDNQTTLGDGTLLTVNNTVDAATGTIALKATFPNQDGALWPGQFVNARLRIRTDQGAVVIPAAAIQHGPDGTFAYQVQPDDTVSVRPIKLTYQQDDFAVVGEGLSGNERVVVAGQSRLEAGTHVAVRPTPPAS